MPLNEQLAGWRARHDTGGRAMKRAGVVALLVWIALAAVALVIVAHARYTADLSAFLPRSPTATQRLMVDQLREGIASRLILIGIEGADAQTRAQVSRDMAKQLRAASDLVSVNNGEPVGLDQDRALLFEHRYLLSEAVTPDHFTTSGLHDAIQDTLELLASPAGAIVKSVFLRDPTGEMIQIIDSIGSEKQPHLVEGAWASRDGKRALLVVQTRAAGSDTDGQEHAMESIRRAFAAAVARARGVGGAAATGESSKAETTAVSGRNGGGSSAAKDFVAPDHKAADLRIEMSGPGVFSVKARATIKHEVTWLSILSTGLIMALLLAVYRSVSALVLGLVPVASGALAGVAAVALGFGVVHGITLGFGVTLIGESVDYSIYLFIQSRQRSADHRGAVGGDGTVSRRGTGAADPSAQGQQSQWIRALWPTIRLGVLTSIVGFASLLPSGFPGLEQLGLYSISGLVAAALVTRFVLPGLLPRRFAVRDVSALGIAAADLLRRIHAPRVIFVVIPLLAVAILYWHRGSIWNRELSALSPLTAADEALDTLLRADIGAPDVSYLVVVSGADQESVLSATERVDRKLDALVDEGVIAGFDSPARYLPSLTTQRMRQASLPTEPQLRERLRSLSDLPLQPEKLEPFVHDVEAARTQALLTRADLAGTSLATGVEALLLKDGHRWTALLPLRWPPHVPPDVLRVQSAVVEAAPGRAAVLDVKREADMIYSSYLSEVVRLSLAGFAAIVVLLLCALRSPARVLRVVAPLALAVLAVAAGLVLSGKQLTILHVIGMLLIVAVGSNYALFFDRRASDRHAGSVPLTLASLVIANAATVVGFGVLASSSVPVLSALGSTVAPGALLALIFSALLARELPAAAHPVPA